MRFWYLMHCPAMKAQASLHKSAYSPKPSLIVNAKYVNTVKPVPGCVAQWVTCLTTDVGLTTDPWVASLIPAQSHTFVEIDHEIISTGILLLSADSFKKGCCQVQGKVCSQIAC